MNIFYVDEDPKIAAESLCDKHVVKMILESAQLLCTAHHLHTLWSLPEKFYKPTHKNHPCSIWVRSHTANYAWLATHAAFLCKEYTYRYGKIHASLPVIDWCLDNFPDLPIGFGTEPPQCMPNEYKMEDTVEAYRRYYNECKRNTIQMKWTRRNPPAWWKQ